LRTSGEWVVHLQKAFRLTLEFRFWTVSKRTLFDTVSTLQRHYRVLPLQIKDLLLLILLHCCPRPICRAQCFLRHVVGCYRHSNLTSRLPMSGRTGSGRSWWACGHQYARGGQEAIGQRLNRQCSLWRHGREALDDSVEKLLEKSFNVRRIQEEGTDPENSHFAVVYLRNCVVMSSHCID
jgi:hypothetical protein